jgi:hypothetical protein
MGSMFGSSVAPSAVAPIVGQQSQSNFLTALFGQGLQPNTANGGMKFSGLPGYPGQLSPDTSQTMLPSVWNNWQPWNGGLSTLATSVNNYGKYGAVDPGLQQLMQWGGANNPGTQGMSNMMQFGAPSKAGDYAANLAQYGVSAQGAGQPLLNLANGVTNTGPASFLAPFLTGHGGPGYVTPSIPSFRVGG